MHCLPMNHSPLSSRLREPHFATAGIQRPTHLGEENYPTGCSKSLFSKAAGESKPEAYPQGYVEDFDEPRTKLAGFFSIRLYRILKGRLGPYRLSQNSTVLKFFKNSTSGRIKVCRA
jgi:hypothetical protein